MGSTVELMQQADILHKKKEQEKIFVCYKCVDNYALKRFIKKESTKKGCDFCHSRCKSIDSFRFLELIHRSIEYFYTQKLYDEGLHWDTKKGQWADADNVHATDELIRYVIGENITDNEELLEYIINSFDNESEWCQVNYLNLTRDAGLILSWDSFEKTVKHKIRYSFLNVSDPIDKFDRYTDHIIPFNEMLGILESMVNHFNLVKVLKKNLILYRCRACDKNKFAYTAKELGLPPVEKASQNRMSPLGIPMLYFSDSPETAIQEIRLFKESSKLAVAGFKLLHNIRIIDFCHIRDMRIPSIFDEKKRDEITSVQFLKHFVNKISEPVKDIKDKSVHLEYVPTQILTEYFRYLFPGKISGIKYPSSYVDEGYNITLFVNEADIAENEESLSDNEIIVLDSCNEYKV